MGEKVRGGCICVIAGGQPYGYDFDSETKEVIWRINPNCEYHQQASEQPWNHRIPWNCPTYWDGCNCDGGPFYEENFDRETRKLKGYPLVDGPE